MRSFVNFKTITKDIFLGELQISLEWSRRSADGFVGLQNFLINILGSKGYDFQSSRNLLAELEKQNQIEIYSYTSEKNERPVSSIRFKNGK